MLFFFQYQEMCFLCKIFLLHGSGGILQVKTQQNHFFSSQKQGLQYLNDTDIMFAELLNPESIFFPPSTETDSYSAI